MNGVFNGVSSRRRFIKLCGCAAAVGSGASLLTGCKDDVVGSEAVSVQATPTPTPTTAPPYSATSADYANFVLQLHYLFGAYMQGGVYGVALPASMVAGSGAAGVATGTASVAFSDALLATQMREVADELMRQIAWLRRVIGAAVTAAPAMNLAGGQGGSFDRIALIRNNAAASTIPPFNPYATQIDFLQGAVALSGVIASAIAEVTRLVDSGLVSGMIGLAAAAAAHTGGMRNSLYVYAEAEARLPEARRGNPSIYSRAWQMSDARDFLDGPSELDRGVGNFDILVNDGNQNGMRRSPEQVLAILYAARTPVAAGAFYPAGVNGVIRYSGSTIT